MRRYEQILQLASRGLDRGTIARRMGVSESAVKTALTRYGTPERHAATKRAQAETARARRREAKAGRGSAADGTTA